MNTRATKALLRNELRDFIKSAFSDDELRQFISAYVGEAAEHTLPGRVASFATLVSSAVDLLERYGCIDDGLFDEFSRLRPFRLSDVDRLRERKRSPERFAGEALDRHSDTRQSLSEILEQRQPLPEPFALLIVTRSLDKSLGPPMSRFDPRRIFLDMPASGTHPTITLSAEEQDNYMAADGEDLDPQLVYRAGQALFELLVGRSAFTGGASEACLDSRDAQYPPLFVSESQFRVSKFAADLIRAATHPNPSERPSAKTITALLKRRLQAIEPPTVVLPTNTSFDGEVVAGYPVGWSNSLFYVSNVSPLYDVRIDSTARGPAMKMWRSRARPSEFGSLMQRIPADYLVGLNIRFGAEVMTALDDGRASLWLRVDGEWSEETQSPEILYFENMSRCPIRGSTPWSRYEIIARIPERARWLNYGFLMMGNGTFWASNCVVEAEVLANRWISLDWKKLLDPG